MDNIVFEKIWQDKKLIELKISVNSEFVSAYQNCYIHDSALSHISDKILDYVDNYQRNCYLEFGKKEGNYTPAFSMDILPADVSGNVKIEVDIEIADNDTRSHRAAFYVKSELGLIEKLGKAFKFLVNEEVGIEVSLLPEF